MKKYSYSNKLRQLSVLSSRLRFLLKDKSAQAEIQINRLREVISKLISELKYYLSKKELVKILGSAALIFGLTYSNQASAQWFEDPVTNPFGLDSMYLIAIPELADLDNDGDLDLMVGGYDGDLQYYENIGNATDPEFDDPISNPFGIVVDSYLIFSAFADLDNDGDLDLMLGDYYGDLKYFENTGSASTPLFADPVVNPFELVSSNNMVALEFVDLDNDGDYDIFLGDYTIETVDYNDYQSPLFQYYENTGTASSPEFATPIENPFGIDEPNYLVFPTFADLDEDGDFDLLAGEASYDYYNYYGGGNLLYYENTGTSSDPDFAAPTENPFGLSATYFFAIPDFADLDNDGDFDIMVGEYYGAMKYFENNGTVGIEDIEVASLSLYPNPIKDVLMIESDETIERIEIVDMLGRSVEQINDPPDQIPMSEMKPGIYLLKFSFTNGEQALKKVLKE